MEKKRSKDKELLAYVGRKTKTVKLLDKFEEMDERENRKYDRLIISSDQLYHNGQFQYCYLVVERGNRTDAAGNITFTDYKQGYKYNLVSFLKEEMEGKDIRKYIDADSCIYFSRPFTLRGQNSSNRTGYGWKWYWPEGYAEEGTYYGETTGYQIIGAYVSSAPLQTSERREFYWTGFDYNRN